MQVPRLRSGLPYHDLPAALRAKQVAKLRVRLAEVTLSRYNESM